MARSLSLVVAAGEAGMRVDALLAARGCYGSRSQAARQIEDGKVFVAGEPAKKRTQVAAGQTVVYEEVPEVRHVPLAGEDIPLDVRYEDDDLLVISKQAGLCVHPAPDHESGTLVNALVYRYGREGLAHVQGEDDRPGIVHRLDMDTSGLMLCARTDECGLALMDLIREHAIDRRYLALVHGNVAFDTGMIDEPIARADFERLRMRVSYKPQARNALTTFRVLERFEAGRRDQGYSLLECRLHTGRTHQIRVHMEHIGHCCVGDPLYRWGDEPVQLGLRRQFLHSWSLRFEHPMGGRELAFTDGLPPDLRAALRQLDGRSMGRTPAGDTLLGVLDASPARADD